VVQLARFNSLAAQYQNKADFLTIYIREAHAQDGWTFRHIANKIKYARKIEDRFAAAEEFISQYQPHASVHVVIDEMSDACLIAYGAYPERLYIVEDGVIMYKGGKGPHGYHVEEVEKWLQKRFPEGK